MCKENFLVLSRRLERVQNKDEKLRERKRLKIQESENNAYRAFLEEMEEHENVINKDGGKTGFEKDAG